MIEPWFIYFLVFATAFVLVQFIYGFITKDLGTRRRVDQRFASVDGAKPRNENLALKVKKRKDAADILTAGPFESLRMLVLQSGLKVSLLHLALFFAIIWGCLYLAVPALPVPFSDLILSGAGSAFATIGILLFVRSRRIARFAEQLPDIIDIIVRSLRAGHPLPISLSLVAREMPEPAGSEFALTCDEITYGREIREALENLYKRIGYEDLSLLVTSISVSHQTGGNLGDILGRLSKMLRERFRMRRKVKSLSSEGRFSALALSVFPFVMFGILNVISPRYYGDVWGHPVLNIAMGIGAILLVTGNIIMYRMVNFKF